MNMLKFSCFQELNSADNYTNNFALKVFKPSFVVCLLCFVQACGTIGPSSNPKSSQADTLASIGQTAEPSPLKVQLLTRQARNEKLAQIYRSMLNIEPEQQVRAQIQHRMLQLDVKLHEQDNTFESAHVLENLTKQYQQLLIQYPNRSENETIKYELAKNLDLQGKQKESLLVIESLLADYPETKYYAELQFRRGELYYNLQHYPFALKAYQAVLQADNNENYQLNSLYMSGWSLFKLNRLAEADKKFLHVLTMIANTGNQHNDFSFSQVSLSHQSLAADTQRVLSISLSQQQQAKSLIALLSNHKKQQKNVTAANDITHFEHILFANLASFLQEQKLHHDARNTYQAYLNYAPDTLWAARFTLALIELYQQNNNFVQMKSLKSDYVSQFGLKGQFWSQASASDKKEVLPHLLAFSLAYSRMLYAKAQDVYDDLMREQQFKLTAQALQGYLEFADMSEKLALKQVSVMTEQYLYADASFEAKQYENALVMYLKLAYQTPEQSVNTDIEPEVGKAMHQEINEALSFAEIQLSSGYAASVTIREMLSQTPLSEQSTEYQALLLKRREIDDLFIQYFAHDRRAKFIAVQQAEFAFQERNYPVLERYVDFILTAYQVDNAQDNSQISLTPEQLTQVQIVSQLRANASYQQHDYIKAEHDYLFALQFIDNDKNNGKKRREIEELIASCIYAQAQLYNQLTAKTAEDYQQAIGHYLRLGKIVPNSKYRANAEFDAANLLLEQEQWHEAVKVLLQFQRLFPDHKYSLSIPAKLALSYEKLALWPKAAEQLLLLTQHEQDIDIKREAQYTAAEYYLKAGDISQAIVHFRTYAHQYPEPFIIAQEVRFKLSELYLQTKQPNKRYFWFRKLIKYHKLLLKNNNVVQSSVKQRSNYLASFAAFHLAQAHQQTFNWTKLKAPLHSTLKRKQQAMKEAIAYYQLVFKWQLAEFVPQANYSIAQMYRRLAADIMSSERPTDLDELALEEYELLLEEIAYPFEEKSIEVHQANAERAWQNIYDQWVKKSFKALAEIEPAKYNKAEDVPEVIDAIF